MDPKYLNAETPLVLMQSCIFLFYMPLSKLRFEFSEYLHLFPISDILLLICCHVFCILFFMC